MPINQSLTEILDKEWEQKSLKEIVKACPSILQGLTPEKAELLKQAIGVKTIEELAHHRFILWAQALTILADKEKLA